MSDPSLVSVSESAGVDVLRELGGYVVDELDAADDPVAALRKCVLLEARADRAMVLAVRQARSAGLTWEQIGELAGVTKSAVHQRFSKRV